MALHGARRQGTAAHPRITGLFAQRPSAAAIAATHHHEGVRVRAIQRLDLAPAQQTALLHHLTRGRVDRIASHLQAVLLLQPPRLLHPLLDLLRALNHHIVQAVRIAGRRLRRWQWRSLVASRIAWKMASAERRRTGILVHSQS